MPVAITADDARALNTLGHQLATNSKYWGSGSEEDDPARSVIRCSFDGGEWRIFVSNAIGAVRVNDVQITVRPKIPLRHFIYLLSFSELVPRSVTDEILVDKSKDLLELIAFWFLNALESLLRRGLVSDYEEVVEPSFAVRGQLNVIATAHRYYSGALDFDCRFDDFGLDTPLNRSLKAAAARIAAEPAFGMATRRRAFRGLQRFGLISERRPGDLWASPDRRSAHYADAMALARLLLESEARTVEKGGSSAWCFLIPTAFAVERGIRGVLTQGLAPNIKVTNTGLTLLPTALTVNPDLVFVRSDAIGDVKYKVYAEEWPRTDLYQSVSFAAAYRVSRALVVSFAKVDSLRLPSVPFGDVDVNNIAWHTELEEPETAAATFVSEVRDWLITQAANGSAAA